MNKYYTFIDKLSGQIRCVTKDVMFILFNDGEIHELKMTLPLEQVLEYYRDQNCPHPWIELE